MKDAEECHRRGDVSDLGRKSLDGCACEPLKGVMPEVGGTDLERRDA